MKNLRRCLLRALHEKHPDTAAHCSRVGALAKRLGEALGLNKHALYILELAAVLHDVGKLGTPTCVLLKPGALTAEEWSVMMHHSSAGARIVSAHGSDHSSEIAAIIEQTHEAVDGSGYPRGLTEDEIRFEAKILAVADTFDAVTSLRCYHDSLSVDEAISLMLSENKLDKALVEKLKEIL